MDQPVQPHERDDVHRRQDQHPRRDQLTRSIRLSVFGIVVVALLAFAPGAFASTVTRDGNNVIFTADPGVSNSENFNDPDADTIQIDTNDPAPADPATSNVTADGSCKDTDGSPNDGQAFQI